MYIFFIISKKDTLCAELCNHAEGSCDEITGTCECDWSDRSVEWCLEGSHDNLIEGAIYVKHRCFTSFSDVNHF